MEGRLRLDARLILFGLLSATVLLALACGSDEPASAPAPTLTASPVALTPSPVPPEPTATVSAEVREANVAYLIAVREGWGLFHEKVNQFGAILSIGWQTSDRMLDALSEAGAGTAFDLAYQAVKEIEPTEAYKSDHELMLGFMAEMVRIDREIGRAAQERDTTLFVNSNARLGEVYTLGGFGLSEAVCRNTLRTGGPGAMCDRGDRIPMGEYGLKMHEVSVRFAPTYAFRVLSQPVISSPEEFIEAERESYPTVLEVLEQAIRAVDALEPPPEAASDHAAIQDFLDEQLETVKAISEATKAADVQQVRRLRQQAAVSTCAIDEVLSSEFRPIVRIFRTADPSVCAF